MGRRTAAAVVSQVCGVRVARPTTNMNAVVKGRLGHVTQCLAMSLFVVTCQLPDDVAHDLRGEWLWMSVRLAPALMRVSLPRWNDDEVGPREVLSHALDHLLTVHAGMLMSANEVYQLLSVSGISSIRSLVHSPRGSLRMRSIVDDRHTTVLSSTTSTLSIWTAPIRWDGKLDRCSALV